MNSMQEISNLESKELINLVLKGKESFNPSDFSKIMSELHHRGFPQEESQIIKNTYSQYDDKILIKIVESENDEFGELAVEIAEGVLLKRGYSMQTDESEYLDLKDAFTDYPQNKKLFYTINKVTTYLDTKLNNPHSTINAGEFIHYRRQIIRDGKELVSIKTDKNEIAYLKNSANQIIFCPLMKLKYVEQDVIIMDFMRFDTSLLSKNLNTKKLWTSKSNKLRSKINIKEDEFEVDLIGKRIKGEERILESRKLIFRKSALNHTTIARLPKGGRFYSIGGEPNSAVNKIKLLDGKEAIIFDNFENHEPVFFGLAKFVSYFTVAIGLCIVLSLIIFAFEKTGLIIFIGFLFVPIFIFLFKYMAKPLYKTLDNLIKKI